MKKSKTAESQRKYTTVTTAGKRLLRKGFATQVTIPRDGICVLKNSCEICVTPIRGVCFVHDIAFQDFDFELGIASVPVLMVETRLKVRVPKSNRTVLFLHDVGTRSSWVQWLHIAAHVSTECEVDCLFLELRELRLNCTKWCDIFPLILPTVLEKLGIDCVQVYAYGFGAGVFLASICSLPETLIPGVHLMLNPEMPGHEELVARHLPPSCELVCYWMDVPHGRTRETCGSRFSETYRFIVESFPAVQICELPVGSFEVRPLAKGGEDFALFPNAEFLSVLTSFAKADVIEDIIDSMSETDRLIAFITRNRLYYSFEKRDITEPDKKDAALSVRVEEMKTFHLPNVVLMNRIFGTSKKSAEPGPPPPSLSEASESIDKRVNLIDEKIRQCDQELIKFKSQMTGPNASAVKNRALTVLKRKKMYEAQRDQLINTQFNVDQANFATENLRITAITVDAMKAGAAQLKQEYAKMNIDSIEQVADEMEDLLYDQQDINEILGRSYAVPDGFDESALESEFAMLEEEVALEKMSDQQTAMPSYIPDTLPGQEAMASAPAEGPSAPIMDPQQKL